MKIKYQIGQVVTSKDNQTLLTIKDYEIFDDLILYYFIEGGAASQEDIILENNNTTKDYRIIKETLNVLVNSSNKEKEDQINQVLKNLDEELDFIIE
jgi:hypothetical protein